MTVLRRSLLVLALLSASAAGAAGERAGEFDYYVLALSWSPNWCVREGDARDSDQCEVGLGHGWTLHGLWPQLARGYPSYCQTASAPPSRAMTARMVDIMGSAGLAWHQWKKHGSCTGLSATDYFALSREASEQVTRPAVFRALDRAVRLPAAVVEEAFLKANPDLVADGLTVTCRDGYIQEVRVCLSRELEPQVCGPDVIRDCTATDALFTPIR